jgi:DNA-binding SARP family transcriptional activator
MENPRLRILLLGPPVITLDGLHLKINRKQQRAGLFYLASQTTPISRAAVCDLFWPNETEEKARKNLREGLSRLRAYLHYEEVIIAENDQLSLNPDLVYIDAMEYNDIVSPLLNSSELNNSSALPDWIYTKLRKAISLCRSDQFLQGMKLHDSSKFQNWVEFTDQAFAFSRQKIVRRLADHCIAIGNIDEAMLWIGKAQVSDPFNVDLMYLMLNCLIERGRNKEALEYLDFVEGIFKTNVGEDFPKILSDFRKRIPTGKLINNKVDQEVWPFAEEDPPPFVGREDLIKKLTYALHRKGIVVVNGAAGSGKTRLVQEFYSRLDFKPRLVFCIGKPLMVSSPFGPLIDGLRATVKPEEWIVLPENIKSDLSLLFPELSSSPLERDRVVGLNDSFEAIQILNSALHVLFVKLAEKRPLLLVIDINSWCDEATIGFLAFLNYQNYFKKHGLFISIFRYDDANPTLEAYVDRSVLTYHLERIDVPSLNLEEISYLSTQLLGHPVTDTFLMNLQKATGGNPFFLVESLRAIKTLDIDPQAYKMTELFPVPPTIRAMVNEITSRLTEDAKKVLGCASVLGFRFTPGQIEAMIEMESARLISSLEELQHANILTAESGLSPHAGYDFTHDQVREVVLQEMSPARKRNLHLRAINALQLIMGDDPEYAAEYAYHYEQAGENDSAIKYWIKSGQYARTRFSVEDTYSSYRHALKLVPRLPSQVITDLVYQLVVEWGDFACDISDDSTCEIVYKECLRIGEDTQDTLLIGTGLNGLGRVATMRHEMEKAIDHLQEARFFLSKTSTIAEQLENHARLAIANTYINDFRSARAACENGLAIKINDRNKRELDAVVNIQTELSFIELQTGFPGKAEELAYQAFENSYLIPRKSARVQALGALAIARYYSGKYKKALESATTGQQLAAQLKMRWWVSFFDVILGRINVVFGKLDQAWSHVTQALERESDQIPDRVFSHSHAILGDIHRLLGDPDGAEQEYLIGTRQHPDAFQTLENQYLLGIALHQKGKLPESEHMLAEIIKKSGDLGFGTISMQARIMHLVFEQQLIQRNNIQTRIKKLIDEMKERGFASSEIGGDFVDGDLAFLDGDEERERKYFQKSLDYGRQSGNPWIELKATLELGRLFRTDRLKHAEYKKRSLFLLDQLTNNCRSKALHNLFSAYKKEIKRRFV